MFRQRLGHRDRAKSTVKTIFFWVRRSLRPRERGEFLECFEVFGRGHWYGTLQSQVALDLRRKVVVLEIDVDGTLAVLEKYPTAVTIFIRPESVAELERRLVARGTETPAANCPAA